MGTKILLTGVILSALFSLPAIMKPIDPPTWFKAIVLSAAIVGLVMIFIGALMVIWA